MSAGDSTRRKVLALLSAMALGVTTIGGRSTNRAPVEDRSTNQGPIDGTERPVPTMLGDSGPPGNGERQTPRTESSPGENVLNPPQGVFDIREFGAAMDGSTNDTMALQQAIRAASPDGTVRIPPGTMLIKSKDKLDNHAIELGPAHRNVTIRGAGPRWTRIVMGPGHREAHFGIVVRTGPTDQIGRIRIENLTLDGNKQNQYGIGHGVSTNASGGLLQLHNCRVTSWRSSGLKMSGRLNADIRFCHFDHNGILRNGGHAIAANQRGKTVVKWSLLEDSGGVDIDVGLSHHASLQTVLVERCVLRNSRGSFKIDNENKRTTIRHVHLLGDDETTIPIKQNPSQIPIGDVVMDNVLIDGGGWPGIDIPAPGRIYGDNVAIKNVAMTKDESEFRHAGVYTQGITWNSFGTLSVENVGPNGGGVAMNLLKGGGRIDEVVLADGVSSGGRADGVAIGRITTGESLVPDVPDITEVGPRDFNF